MRKRYEVHERIDGNWEVRERLPVGAVETGVVGMVLAAAMLVAMAAFLPLYCPWRLGHKDSSIPKNIAGTFVGIFVWMCIVALGANHGFVPGDIMALWMVLFVVLVAGALMARANRFD
jgi:hypothetical protein